MSILTQKVEIYDDSNPLESQMVTFPVHKGIKIMSHETYASDDFKKYDRTCTSENMDVIRGYEESRSFKAIREGMVSSYNTEKQIAEVSLSPKHCVVVNVNNNENIGVGDKIDVVVTKQKGKLTADASSKVAQLERLKQELIKEIENPTVAYIATVKEPVYNTTNTFNGFIVDIRGVKCFMPGTESDVVPLNDYNELIGKTLYVMPVAQSKDSIVVSHKEYLNTLKPGIIKQLVELPKESIIQGVISSVKHFGVFILINECVATLLSVSEMNEETESKFKSGELKVGDNIGFLVDNITNDRITVTQTVSKTEGWEKLNIAVNNANHKYKLKCVIKNIFENGVVFLSEQFNGITFFLSSKVISLEGIKIGSTVELNVESVDTSKKTVRLLIE